MEIIRNKWHSLGVQGKLHILIQGSLIILFLISMDWVIGRFESQIMSSAKARAEETADGLINGMNMLMLTGQISNPDNRKLLLSKMSQSKGISELRIIRGQSVIAQFGPGLPEEQAKDDLDRRALTTGQRQFLRIEKPDGPSLLRVEVPFIALENFRGTNCLACHHTPLGGVNGVASVTIDLSQEEETLSNIKRWLWAGHIALQIFLSFVISWIVRVLIVRNIARPIRKLQTAMTEIQRENDLSKRVDIDESNRDVGEMARAFNSLVDNLEHATERLELFGKMFHGSSEAFLITDAERRIVAVNPAFTEITGYSAFEVMGKNPSILSSGKQTPAFYESMWYDINETGQWQGEIWNRRKTGEVFPEWLSISVLKNHKGEIINYISLFSDITERKAAEQKIAFLAHHDALTKLPNRALFADRLSLALSTATRHSSKVGLLFLDLDKFKHINDSMGHLAGDQLLESVATRLKSCVRESDTICRHGGDEFMILLPDAASARDIELVAQKIIAAMSAPHHILGQNLNVTFSIGISIFPDNAADSDAMIKCADAAMYRAKERGRNNYQFFTSPDAPSAG